METQTSTLLNWPYYYQGKSIEELKHSLVCTTLELETTKLAAQEEIRRREDQLTHLKKLLNKTISERDEAQENCKTLLLEKLLLQKQQKQQQTATPHSGSSSSIEDEPTIVKNGVEFLNNGNNLCSSDSDDSIISSPPPPQPSHSALSAAVPEQALQLLSVQKKTLPEKGNLLQAVIKAGPLLQTLLLAGPLPQWRHPPPPLGSFDIPPVTINGALITQGESSVVNVSNQEDFMISSSNICGDFNKKRGFCSYGVCDGSSPESNSKYQRVLLH